MKPFGMNLLIAVIWLLLSQEPSPVDFAFGFAVGFGLLLLFRPVLRSEAYVRRSLAFVRFLTVFLHQFVIANVKVAYAVLFRSRESLHPNFVTYDTSSLKPHEILILSYCITLTPGTTTVDIAEDFDILIFHALDADDPDQIRASIDRTLKTAIISFTR
jgi:multicomponent Na+:H+ antiporter subunit E